MKHAISTRWLEIPNESQTHFPHNFLSSSEILIHYQSKHSRTREVIT